MRERNDGIPPGAIVEGKKSRVPPLSFEQQRGYNFEAAESTGDRLARMRGLLAGDYLGRRKLLQLNSGLKLE